MPPWPSSIPTCFFSRRFRNNPLGEWETGLGSGKAKLAPPPHPLPTQCGSPTDHNVRPYREHAGGHLWFAGIQMNVYEPCLAAKGQALSWLLQPLSWVRLRLSVLALTCLLSPHVFITPGWSGSLKATRVKFFVCVYVCMTREISEVFDFYQRPRWFNLFLKVARPKNPWFNTNNWAKRKRNTENQERHMDYYIDTLCFIV